MTMLVVDLRTDIPRREIRLAEIHLIRRRRRNRIEASFVAFTSLGRGDPVRGVRLTDIEDLDNGNYLLVVRLLDRRGAAIGLAQSIVGLRGDRVVTMLITRA